MTADHVRAILSDFEDGTLDLRDAEARILDLLRRAPFEDLGFARIDHHRGIRQGCPEIVFGAGKTAAQTAAIAERIVANGDTLIVTRTGQDAFEAVRALVPDAQFHPEARVITRPVSRETTGRGTVLVVAAGTSDLPVAEEARVSAEALGNRVDVVYDAGVAGLHRLLAERERLDAARVVIAVAGMEGALPSVVRGLVRAPVIAVPTSIGYGTNFGGLTALLGMLNSCATGVAVVNIDNGLGAATMASLINHLT
ncbi:MAG: nickel pincer cofactor biosynthesis protein LarB [Acidobacteria bacterium]|nr:nickel pincer cofactor biosynthesis protein LarB [Acidobacteriota bacterium]